MKSIQIKYFASLKDKAGSQTENLTVDFSTYVEVYDFLASKYDFSLPSSMIQVAVNDEFGSMKDIVMDGATVVFIPPVAGG